MAITDVDKTEFEPDAGGPQLVSVGSLPAPLRRLYQEQHPGAWNHFPEMAGVLRWLRENSGQCGQVWLCAARPGQFQQSDVDQLLDQWPLLPILHIADSWCEGELRSGWPLQGVQRKLLAEIVDELSHRFRSPLNATSWQPRTAQHFEQWMIPAAGPDSRSLSRDVLIWTQWRESWLALHECLCEAGHRAAWWQPSQAMPAGAFDTLIVDFGLGLQGDPRAENDVSTAGFSRRIAIIGFLRPQDSQRLAELGFTHVLSKPYRMGDLLAAVAADDSRQD